MTTAEIRERQKQQISATLGTIRIIADAIKELGSVPSGHLYATCMATMSLREYEYVIAILVKTDLVELKNNLLTWKGV